MTEEKLKAAASYNNLQDYHQSIACSLKAIRDARKVGDRRTETAACTYLTESYYCLGDYQECIEWAETTIRIASELQGMPQMMAKAYVFLAKSYYSLKDYQQSATFSQQAISVAKEVGDKRAEADACTHLAGLYCNLEDYQKSIEYAKEGIGIAKAVTALETEAVAYSFLSKSYCGARDYQQSVECAEMSITIAKGLGVSMVTEMSALLHLAAKQSCNSLADYQQSFEYAKELLSVAMRLEDINVEKKAYIYLARAYKAFRDNQEDTGNDRQAVRIVKEGKDEKDEAEAYLVLSFICQDLHYYHLSIECAKQAIEFYKEMQNKQTIALAHCNLAASYRSLGDYQQSIHCSKQAIAIAEEAGDRTSKAEAHRHLAASNFNQGDYEKSIESTKQMMGIVKEDGKKDSEAIGYLYLAEAYNGLGDYQESIECAKQAISISRELGDRNPEAVAYRHLAASHNSLHNFHKSIESAKQAINIAKDVGLSNSEAAAYRYQALSFNCLGNYEQSVKCAKQAIRIAKKNGFKKTEAATYYLLARSCGSHGDNCLCGKHAAIELESLLRDPGGNNSLEPKIMETERIRTKQDANNIPLCDSAEYSFLARMYERFEKWFTDDLEDSGAEKSSKGKRMGASKDLNALPSNDSVPIEIEVQGQRARLAYENALMTGKVKVNRARIMFIGQDRSGKTSLKKSLLGLPFDPHEQSTDGVEVVPSKFEVDLDQVKNWRHTDGKLGVSLANSLARMVAGTLKKEKERADSRVEMLNLQPAKAEFTANDDQLENKPRDPSKESKSQTKRDSAEDENADNTTKRPEPDVKIDPAQPPEEYTERLIKYLKRSNSQRNTAETDNQWAVDLWDFAGQQLYYSSHPVFFSPRAVYVLVYNLSKRLQSTAQPYVTQGGVHTSLQNPNGETNLQNLVSWLVSVNTLCSMDESKDLPYLRPAVFIVGTHADEPIEDIKKMERQIQSEIFGKNCGRHVIRPFFSIDNMTRKSGDGVVKLQKRLMEVLRQEPYMGQEIPARWFNFEKVVEALVAKGTYYLHLEQLQTIIQQVCFIDNEDEAATMLDFYHNLGVIVKHHSTVVLRTQWLIDLFRQLITIRPYNEMEPRHDSLWKKLEETGILSVELVDHVFSKFCQQGVVKEDILDMMEKFGLIVKFAAPERDVRYLVPVQLRAPPGRLSRMEPSGSDPCTLYINFPEGFIPHGLYSQLVSRCASWCCERRFKQPPNLFNGASRFFIEMGLLYQLILVCKARFVKIVLKQSKKAGDGESWTEAEAADEMKEVASLVWGVLDNTLHDLSRSLSWLNNLKYDWRAACPSCPKEEIKCRNHGEISCTHEDCLCLLEILSGEQLRNCPNSDEVPTLPSLKTWFAIKAVRPGNHPGTSDVYNMTTIPRGIALIINIKSFRRDVNLRFRVGSREDVRQLEDLFKALGFDVRKEEDLTKKDLLSKLDSVANEDHSSYDCFVLWLMSHGRSGEVYCSDGETLPIKTAQDMFSKCKTLQEKPKLFFIQACRGEKEDEGVTQDRAAATPIPSLPQCPSLPSDNEKPPASKMPTHADFLYSYATVDEHVSYRHQKLGSYYVQGLVEAFRERAVNEHLLDILTNVNQRVSGMVATLRTLDDKTKMKDFKQVSQFESTLRKKVRF